MGVKSLVCVGTMVFAIPLTTVCHAQEVVDCDSPSKDILIKEQIDVSGCFNNFGLSVIGRWLPVEPFVKYGLINRQGEYILPVVYNHIEYPDEWIYQIPEVSEYHKDLILLMRRVANDYAYSYVDKEGRVVVPEGVYGFASNFSEGRAFVQKHLDIGFIDNTGKAVIDFKYSGVRPFREGWASVSIDDQWGMIDRLGNQVMPFIYDDLSSLYRGHAIATKGNKEGVITKDNDVIIAFDYEYIGFMYGFDELSFLVRSDTGKQGVINAKGETIIPVIYDAMHTGVNRNIVLVTKSGKQGVFDAKGRQILPVHFDFIELEEGYIRALHQGEELYFDLTGVKISEKSEYTEH